jgi:indole-3-glycerol phosphate synthase
VLDSLLHEIVAYKTLQLKAAMEKNPEKKLLQAIQQQEHPLPLEIDSQGLSIIAEIKPASPISGRLQRDAHASEIALSYQEGGASAISVLTEERFFKGSPAIFMEAKKAVRLPLMRKDFIFHSYQIIESRAMMADGILLIVRLLKNSELKNLLEEAKSLGMFILVEAFDEQDIDRALESGAEIIGINSRDLKDFSTKLDRFAALSARIPDGKIKIAESGIKTIWDIKEIKKLNFHGVLIGEALMRSSNPVSLLRELKDASKN